MNSLLSSSSYCTSKSISKNLTPKIPQPFSYKSNLPSFEYNLDLESNSKTPI